MSIVDLIKKLNAKLKQFDVLSKAGITYTCNSSKDFAMTENDHVLNGYIDFHFQFVNGDRIDLFT